MGGYVWELPFASGLTGAPGAILRGWSFGGIITLQTGTPFMITQSGDSQNLDSTGDSKPNLVPGQKAALDRSERRPFRWFNTAAFSRSVLEYGNAPRNMLFGPATELFDLSLAKAFKMPYRDNHRLEFRANFFNAFNRPQFDNPGSVLGTGSFGVVTGTKGNNREIQFGLKYIF
ncbi:MAG: hypothetical protein DMG07_13390 [Acidobacteria bacterium]|nr:MAG: hypothetical protein DMG07_13390 [Acidobacteriota bacterium]